MVTQTIIIDLAIGVVQSRFIIQRSPKWDEWMDMCIEFLFPSMNERFRSRPAFMSPKDFAQFSEYIYNAVASTTEPNYVFLTYELGFMFSFEDIDEYESVVNLFALAAEPPDDSRSYVGCQGPVLNKALLKFANDLKKVSITPNSDTR